MTWPVLVLLVGATGLATAGAVVTLGQRAGATEEVGVRHAIAGFGLLAASVALAAVGGALLGAGGTPTEQIGAFSGASATVALPVLTVALTRRARVRRWT
ncbi:hypothetical protein SAMN05660748_2824 [Blastococcus aggregatus]|uniref:Uncharacterized protein n=1 Tax=Blastococcus aggregatus TaxID=38502 RepID=A0A285V7I9_9ACTN|nr:hypothetical protein [Blastococcus aggregatus]SOC50085.1 hypothetical protein SAMN05660748_2824 [Blastococcus aggregatus]